VPALTLFSYYRLAPLQVDAFFILSCAVCILSKKGRKWESEPEFYSQLLTALCMQITKWIVLKKG